MRLTRVQFPNNFNEARRRDGGRLYTLPARHVRLRDRVRHGRTESAALLYMILADKGVSGMNYNADDATIAAHRRP